MKNRMITFVFVLAALTSASAQDFKVKVNTDKEPIAEGKYKPTWESLSDYQCPEWFRDAKLGLWAHWGPQCQPEFGDWFARNMYVEGSDQYRYNLYMKGHPSQFGFKDWIHEWKAEKWDPEHLIKLYKEAGAKYFMALANHHDNFDLYDSKYQPWNSVNMGPEKDLIGGWAKACKENGIPFGVSVHAAHAWCWYEVSRGADTKGLFKGVPYDGVLTKADGKGKWWEGYDPQDLYEQRHELSKNNREWDWKEGVVTTPDQAYCDKFYNRTMDLINKYDPSIIYFDDTVLPLYPVSDAGLDITAHFYNKSMKEHGGKNEAVLTGKILNEDQKKAIVWDVERGAPDKIQPTAWQTCTCIGSWHYDKRRYYEDSYKTPQDVIRILADVVSKNGNLLLNIPVKGDGTIDSIEEKVVEGIGAWMKVNGEAIYGTRPWKIYGEGPSAEQANPINAQGFNEGKVKMSYKDIRFTSKGKALYAILLGVPAENVMIKNLGKDSKLLKEKIKNVFLLGTTEKVAWKQNSQGLAINIPSQFPNQEAIVYKIMLK